MSARIAATWITGTTAAIPSAAVQTWQVESVGERINRITELPPLVFQVPPKRQHVHHGVHILRRVDYVLNLITRFPPAIVLVKMVAKPVKGFFTPGTIVVVLILLAIGQAVVLVHLIAKIGPEPVAAVFRIANDLAYLIPRIYIRISALCDHYR